MADSKVSALSQISVPALEDLLYTVDDPSGTPVSNSLAAYRFLGQNLRGICGFRLTTESGVGVSTSDRTAQGTIYATPYGPLAGLITVYDGTRWKLYDNAEMSLALTVTSGKNYDVFVYDNAGTLTLELSAAWTNDTTRADALTTQNNISVKSGATTRRWIGTIRASGTNTTEDSFTKRYLWNKYNQVERDGTSNDATSHTYAVAAFREWNNGTNSVRIGTVSGEAQIVKASLSMGMGNSTGSSVQGAIGLDSTTVDLFTNDWGPLTNSTIANGTTWQQPVALSLGFHEFVPLEYGNTNGTSTFYVYSMTATLNN